MPRAKRGTKDSPSTARSAKLAKGNVGGRRKLYRAAR
jgi:ribosomal protein L20